MHDQQILCFDLLAANPLVYPRASSPNDYQEVKKVEGRRLQVEHLYLFVFVHVTNFISFSITREEAQDKVFMSGKEGKYGWGEQTLQWIFIV